MRHRSMIGGTRAAGSVTVIRPPRRWPDLDLAALVGSRELLAIFAGREIKLRYRQTVLGAAWIVAAPALTAAVFSFVFSSVARLPSGGVPYFLLALVGMLGWSAFANGISRCSQSMVTNAPLLTKIYFERLALVLGTLLSTLVDVAVVLVLVAIAMAALGVAPGWSLATLPLWLAGLIALATGIGLVAGSLMVRYRDLTPIVTLGLQILLYASPVAYSTSAVPPRLRPVFDVNPLVGLLDGLRWSVLDTTRPAGGPVAYSAVCAVVLLVVGFYVFRRQERTFADVI